MKIPHLILFFSLLSVSSGRAEWILVQEIEIRSEQIHQTNQNTLKIKGNKIRMNMGSINSTIMDGESGDQIVLMHPQKQYMVQSASRMKELRELLKKTTPQTDNTLV